MNTRCINRLIMLLVILLTIGIPTGHATADVGPKPTIEFKFEQDFEGEPVKIVDGALLQCSDPNCADAKSLEQLGPQYFACKEALTCSGLAYGFEDYGQLKITFSDDKVRESNVFRIKNFNSYYNVTIYQDELLVKERPGPRTLFTALLCLCCCGLVILVMIVIGAIIITQRRKTVA